MPLEYYKTPQPHKANRGTNMTVSDKKEAPTPYLDKLESMFERVGNKIADKMENEMEHNPTSFFTKILLCVVCCARIVLGDNDPDVRILKLVVSDTKFKDGLDKEIIANPEQFRRRGMLT